jgi:hypothetical protein
MSLISLSTRVRIGTGRGMVNAAFRLVNNNSGDQGAGWPLSWRSSVGVDCITVG